MNKFKILSIGACVALCMGFASCENDEPGCNCEQIKDESGILIEQEVDLGLPSGTIWAGWNVGASSPEQFGGYYAWGEIEEKSNYSLKTYKYWTDKDGDGYYDRGEFIDLGENISGTQYDVARQKWGGDWRMPTEEEVEELIDNCTWMYFNYKGINGYKVIGPNGNCIFLPAAGCYYGTELEDAGGHGNYLIASMYGHCSYEIDNCAWFNFDGFDGFDYSGYGYTVRPVK